MVSRILLSHPHATDVAKAAASALSKDMLAAFITGAAIRKDGWLGRVVQAVPHGPSVVDNRLLNGLSLGQLWSLPVVEFAARAAAKTAARIGSPQPSTYDALYLAHDAAVAAMPWPRRTDAIYAYEDGALWSFARARMMGALCLWDLPSPHWATVEGFYRQELERWPGAHPGRPPIEPAWKKTRKDAELDAAHHVMVASRFCQKSVVDVRPNANVHVVPYGFPVERFPQRESPPSGPFTVLSVGAHSLRKGTPYLLEAFKQARLKDARLMLVGSLNLSKSFLDGYAGLFTHVPSVPKASLGALYAQADVLCFPTLCDGFGLVIQEAMCTGVPVITTPNGGGPECVTDDEDGVLVPAQDVDGLVEALRRVASNRDAMVRLGIAARRRAERYTWADAGDALRACLGAIH